MTDVYLGFAKHMMYNDVHLSFKPFTFYTLPCSCASFKRALTIPRFSKGTFRFGPLLCLRIIRKIAKWDADIAVLAEEKGPRWGK